VLLIVDYDRVLYDDDVLYVHLQDMLDLMQQTLTLLTPPPAENSKLEVTILFTYFHGICACVSVEWCPLWLSVRNVMKMILFVRVAK
jgi:hypothetical protein